MSTINNDTEKFVDAYILENGKPPTYKQVQLHFNLSNRQIARGRCIKFIGKMNADNILSRLAILQKKKLVISINERTTLYGESKRKLLDDCEENNISISEKMRECVRFYYEDENVQKRKLDILYKNSLK